MSAPLPTAAALWSDRLTRAAAVLAAFLLPITTAGANLALGLFMLFWLASPRLLERLRAAADDPVARAALALLLLVLAGTLWTSATPADAWNEAGKYRKLVLLAMLLAVMGERRWQRAVLFAFVAGALVVVGVALLITAGVLPPAERGGPGNAVAFKNHITESFVSALVFFGLLTVVRWDARPLVRSLALIGAAACAAHVLWLLIGRTGYVTLLLLLFTWAALAAGWRRSLAAAATGTVALAMLLPMSPAFMQRAHSTIAEVQQYGQTREPGSIAVRYDFARGGWRLWQQSPLWGHGVGSVPGEYRSLPDHGVTTATPPSHLHSEVFGLAAQLGLLGLAAFGALLWFHARRAVQLAGAWRHLAIGLLVAFGIGALYNSLLRDFTEGHLYVLLAGTLLARPRGIAQDT